MMDFEDVRVQLIDLPPVTADHYESAVTDLTRAADAALLFLDLADDDGPAATVAAYDRLKLARRELVPARDPDADDPTTYALPTLLIMNKSDDEAADIRLEMAKESLAGHPVRHAPRGRRQCRDRGGVRGVAQNPVRRPRRGGGFTPSSRASRRTGPARSPARRGPRSRSSRAWSTTTSRRS